MNKMIEIIPGEIPMPQLHGYLLGAIGPRPIAFASTVDKDGNPNLAPFSFFNIFGSNPPTLIFSPSRRGRDNSTKHTYQNIKEFPEVVINVVNYSMVQQVNLASNEFPKQVNEFTKAGFTPLKSDLVKPMRVAESPVQMECKVKQVIETGFKGGAGNLVICEILKVHIHEAVLDETGKVDPHKIDLVGRLGGDYYCRASGDAVFMVKKPEANPAIGIDQLPESIKLSKILTGNDLGQLGGLTEIPDHQEIQKAKSDERYLKIRNESNSEVKLHTYARELIAKGEIIKAFCLLSY